MLNTFYFFALPLQCMECRLMWKISNLKQFNIRQQHKTWKKWRGMNIFARHCIFKIFFFTSNHCLFGSIKYESSIHNIAYALKVILSNLNQERKKHRLSTNYKWKHSKTVLNKICWWILRGQVDGLFHWRKHYYGLWTSILARSKGFKLKCLDGIVSYKHAAI